MYRTDALPFLPLTMATAAAGNYALLTPGYATVRSSLADAAQGVNYSVLCGERLPFLTPEAVAQATVGVRPEIRDFGLPLVTQLRLDVCDFWDVDPPAADENRPVASTIPTLILAGEYDPITPPFYGEEAAQTLSHSYFFEFRGFGHGELRALSQETARPRCAMQLVSAFLDDPLSEPDGSCVADLPAPRFL
jgi:pimeloyl-ACP methyl ester carboxylesterase